MTVQSTLARIAHTISGAGPYSIPFYFLANTDIIAIRTPALGGNPVTLTLTTNYTLTGAGDEAGGALTLTTVANGDTLTIINEPPINQLTSYPETGKFPAKSHETALDKLTIAMKRVYDLASRGLRLNDGDAATSLVLPVSSPGKLIGWATDGKLTNTSPTAIGPNAITATEIANGAITSIKLSGGAITTVVLTAYPVGCLFISTVATNPATSLGGGTWASFGAGRVLVGIDPTQIEFDVVEEVGGTKTHTLTATEIPAHTHTISAVANLNGSGTGQGAGTANQATFVGSTDPTGGGGAHNNLQPYIVVYFWKRTA